MKHTKRPKQKADPYYTERLEKYCDSIEATKAELLEALNKIVTIGRINNGNKGYWDTCISMKQLSATAIKKATS